MSVTVCEFVGVYVCHLTQSVCASARACVFACAFLPGSMCMHVCLESSQRK